jgi:hypothetical protein
VGIHEFGYTALPADAVVKRGAALTKMTSFVRFGFLKSIHNTQSKGDGKKG